MVCLSDKLKKLQISNTMLLIWSFVVINCGDLSQIKKKCLFGHFIHTIFINLLHTE